MLAGRVRHSFTIRTSRSSPNAAYCASNASVTPSVYMITRSPGPSATQSGTLHFSKNAHRDAAFLEVYWIITTTNDKRRVMAGH